MGEITAFQLEPNLFVKFSMRKDFGSAEDYCLFVVEFFFSTKDFENFNN